MRAAVTELYPPLYGRVRERCGKRAFHTRQPCRARGELTKLNPHPALYRRSTARTGAASRPASFSGSAISS
jgi:hypothetical protein